MTVMLKEILEEIHSAGLSEAEIAVACRTSQPTIHRLRRGKQGDTRSSIADAVRALHAKLKAQGRIGEEAAAA